MPSASSTLSGFDDINVFNGNLRFSLPLLTVGGRGEEHHTVALPIITRWTVRHSLTDPFNEIFTHVAEQDWWSGYHLARYSPGRLLARPSNDGSCGEPGAHATGSEMRLTFVGPDGSELELLDANTGGAVLTSFCGNSVGASRGTVFVSYDGSGVTFVSDATIHDSASTVIPPPPSGYLLFRDGTRYRIAHGKVVWSRDRNGNRITFDYDAPTQPFGRLTKITDSLQREVNITYQTAPGGAPIADELTYKGFNGTGRTIRVEYDNLGDALRQGPNGYTLKTATDLFGLDNGNFTFDPTVVSSVVLPDGVSRYHFYYNSHGELARVSLPTGGAYEYDWGPSLAGGAETGVVTVQTNAAGSLRGFPEIYRRVLTRRVMAAAGAVEGVTTYSQTQGQGTAAVNVTVDYKKADGVTLVSREKHYFHGNPVPSDEVNALGLEPWKAGREYQTDLLDSDGQTVLRQVTQEWELGSNPSPAYNGVPRVKETATTLSDSNQTSRMTFSYDQYNNTTDVYAYGFGGELLYRKRTDYETAAVYTAAVGGAHLRSLPKLQWVSTDLNGSNKVARTAYAYDQYDLTDRPNITGICTYFSGHVCSATGPNGEGSADYTTRGNVTGVTRYADAATPAGAVSLSSRYDIAGNAVSTTDSRNQTATTTYGDGVCVGALCGTPSTNTFAFPVSSKTPKPDPTGTYGSSAELTSSAVYDFYTGLTRSTTDANDQTTTLDYHDAQSNLDSRDRLRAVVRPDGGRTDYEYGDEPGNVYVRTLADLDGTRRLKSEQHFDGLGRPYRSFTWEGQDADNPWLTVDTLYDALGRVWRNSNPYRSAGPGSELDEERAGKETTFDGLGRVTRLKTTADGASIQTAYKDTRMLVTDQAGNQRLSITDALGYLREVWEVTPNDSSKYPGIVSIPSEVTAGLLAAGYGYRTEYLYDVRGNLRTVKQGTQERFFAYDSLGRLVREKHVEQGHFTPDAQGGDFPALTDPVSDNAQWSAGYLYDGNGNLTKRRDARGTTTTYGYDALNRNTTTTYTLGGEPEGTPGVLRYYDNTENGANGKGRLWKTVTAQTALTIVGKYDEAGQPEEQTQKFWVGGDWGPQAYTTKVSYDKAGGVTWQEYPSGRTVEYQYDAAGRLGDNGALPAFKGTLGDGVERTYVSHVLYDELGGMSQERFGTQTPVYNKRFYNVRGQLADIRVSTHPITNADPDLRTDWNRGAILNHYSQAVWGGSDQYNNGSVRTQQVWVPHDDLIGGWSLFEQSYTYDALNRLRKVSEGNQWQQEYDYDRWGNRTINAAGTWLGQPSAAPSDSINEKQFDKGDLPDTNRLYAPGDAALLMSQRRMQYDGAGNLTVDSYTGAGSRAYDAENRMTSAQTGPAQTVAYTYNADGQRVKRLAGAAGEVWQVYGVGGELLAEYAKEAPHNAPQREYGYRGGELLMTVAAAEAGWGPAPTFFENPLNPNHPGETPVRAQHIAELRAAVNALRAHMNLPAYVWQAPAGVGDPVTTGPITEMRAALDEALGAPSGGYSAGLGKWQPILAVHLQELRNRVLNAWQPGGGGVSLRWHVTDQVGTPRMVVDKAGSLSGVSRHDYLPFGEEIGAGVGGRANGPADAVRQRFVGYEFDDETDLNFAEARYFSAQQGRFTSADPFIASARRRAPQSWNRYSYALNNPLKYVDPSGESWIIDRKGNIFFDRTVTTEEEARKKYGRGVRLFDGRTGVVRSTGGDPRLRVGYEYTFHADGTVTSHGRYVPPSPPPLSPEHGDRVALEVIKLVLKAWAAGATGGTSALGLTLGGVGLAAEVLPDEDEPDEQTAAMAATTSGGGAFTEPTLPPSKIAEEDGVTIKHNYKSNDHPPAHAHVEGEGPKTRVGPSGKPLPGEPPLSPKQRAVVRRHKQPLRRSLAKAAKWIKYMKDFSRR